MDGIGVAGEATWTTPELTGIGRLPMRSPLIPFPDAASARDGRREATPWFRSLDGRWRFALAERPDAVPAGFAAPDFDDATWDDVDVPGNWTVQGYDRPHYTNIFMPFPQRPPRVPDDNPTGLYRTALRVPRTWRGKRIVLHVGGAESVLHVFVNGRRVGVSKDSRLPAEFDITDHVQVGRSNTLACMVVRWSDASHIEDQDHWWMAGIHREVYLYATDDVYLADVEVRAGLAADADGDLTIGTLDVRATAGFRRDDLVGPGWQVTARLEDLTGDELLEGPLSGEVPHDTRPYLFAGHVVRRRAQLAGVRPWSAEDPHLYRVVVSLIDPEGSVREVVAPRVGFRSVEVRDRQLLINGAPVYIRGVNRHDHNPRTGKTVSEADMRADLVTMKRFNVNAVRCSHYPNDSRFYDLCDELGLYVVDEADIESHAWIFDLCHDPRYLSAFVDRAARMVRRDKNHACIIAWSLGNESGYGAVHDAMAGWIRHADPTRPLHYEGAVMDDLFADAPCTDLVCPMYPSIDAITTWSREAVARAAATGTRGDRPLIMCEYSHAMGNSNGSLADYWAAIESHDGLQGGFIWEWKDHGIQRERDGRTFYGYGGQFGDEPNDANFVADGLVGPEGDPHPAMWEHLWLGRPARVEATPSDLRKGRVRVANVQWFRDLGAYEASFEVLVDGAVVESGSFPLPPIPPQSSAVVEVPFARPVLSAGQRAHLTIRFRTREASAWADAGHVVGWDQLELRARPPGTRRTSPRAGALAAGSAGVDVERDADGEHATVRAAQGRVELLVDVASGAIERFTMDGHDLLVAAPRCELWRAATDNDGMKLFLGNEDRELWVGMRNKPLTRWLRWGLDALHRAPVSGAVGRRAGVVTVRSKAKLWGADAGAVATHRQVVTVRASGELEVAEEIIVPATWDDLPRVGVALTVPAGYERYTWFGQGPHENYVDRRASTITGRWESTVDEQYVPYLMPQEHGCHTDVRWCTLEDPTDPARPGLLIAAGRTPATTTSAAAGNARHVDEGLHVTVSHHSTQALWAARDWTELERSDEVFVHLDQRQRGLGTGSCGPDTLPQYLVPAGAHRFGWRLRPYEVGVEDPATLARAAEG